MYIKINLLAVDLHEYEECYVWVTVVGGVRLDHTNCLYY